MNPESAPSSNEALPSVTSQEKFLGRLINLREQLTDKEAFVYQGPIAVEIFTDSYSSWLDDLDDIIRSIKRGMKENECDGCIYDGPRPTYSDFKPSDECPYCGEPCDPPTQCKCCGREKELDDGGVCFGCWEREKKPDSEDTEPRKKVGMQALYLPLMPGRRKR